MKKTLLFSIFILASFIANAQYYQLRYDSVRVVSKLKLGAVTTGASTDSLLTKKANGGVYKVAQSNFANSATYVPYTGGTTDLNLGAHGFYGASFEANLNFSGSYAGGFSNTNATGKGVYIMGGSVSTTALYVTNYNNTVVALDLKGDGTATFASNVKSSVVPTVGADLTNKTYVDAQIAALTVSNVIEVSGTSQTASAGRVYQTLSASMTTITLPASSVNGATVIVNGIGAGKWRIQQGNAGDLIKGVGGFTTVAGATHGVETSDANGTLSLRYNLTTTTWVVTSQNGSIATY